MKHKHTRQNLVTFQEFVEGRVARFDSNSKLLYNYNSPLPTQLPDTPGALLLTLLGCYTKLRPASMDVAEIASLPAAFVCRLARFERVFPVYLFQSSVILNSITPKACHITVVINLKKTSCCWLSR
jgi:hypothetical protein